MSSPEPVWITPSPSPPKPALNFGTNRLEVEESASPCLRGGKVLINMKRTPQPILTQSRLTGSGILQIQGSAAASSSAPKPPDVGTADEAMSMDIETSTTAKRGVQPELAVLQPPVGGGLAQPAGMVVTTDFLLKTLKVNTDEIIKSFTTNLGALSSRVDGNALRIADNSAAIADQGGELSRQRGQLEAIRARVSSLEKGRTITATVKSRAILSKEYEAARNSIRIWPIPGVSEQEMWEMVGDFIHDTLRVPTADVGQEDIISIGRTDEEKAPGSIKDEVVVRFRDRRTRDTVMSCSVNLAERVDQAGRPTAGTRLEIPQELKDTFRLLSRFGPGCERDMDLELNDISNLTTIMAQCMRMSNYLAMSIGQECPRTWPGPTWTSPTARRMSSTNADWLRSSCPDRGTGSAFHYPQSRQNER